MARIVVLDDEKDACELIERVLSPAHEVVSFTEEDEAIAYVKANPVDLAILDIKLKKLSGVDVLEILRQARPEVKAVMLTGYPTLKTAERAITLGAHEYLTKPLDVDDLEAKVNGVLSPEEPLREQRTAGLSDDLSPSE
ncbi:MAG: response regulator [Deltaproteobacteria bacterium]|nr:response regulator [Deltaproteobacteria bacterium]